GSDPPGRVLGRPTGRPGDPLHHRPPRPPPGATSGAAATTTPLASITWGWSRPSMTTTCSARSPSATRPVPRSTGGLYLTILHALGARPRAQKAELIAQAQTLLAAEEHERRRRVVFIIDEAHLLAPDQLEELRPLTNAETDSQSPFALLLVGQPTLARQLRLGVFAALDQRIATRYQLAPMDLANQLSIFPTI